MIMAVEDEDDNAPEQDEDPDNAPAAGIYIPVLGVVSWLDSCYFRKIRKMRKRGENGKM